MRIPVGRVFALLVVALGAVLVIWSALRGDESGDAAPSPEVVGSTTFAPSPPSIPIPVLGVAQDLTDIDGWINTDASSFEEARGEVTIVQFWTFGCFNCKNTLPYLSDIYSKYHADGLEIIGVHAPEFDYEADAGNVETAVVDLGIQWPVALDTRKTNFRSWQEGGRRYWPRTFVVDSDGAIRFDHIGEGAYAELEDTVARLLAAAG
jgi:thiol-disulfide isomerase/thioredoxin